MFILVLVGGFLAAFVLLVLLLWWLSKYVDQGIKEYIDYAKKGEECDRR